MAGRVAVVTDCTACLPAELAPQLGVTVVPLRIVAGGLAADDGPGVLDGPLGGELRRGQRLSTARPGPAKFAAAYAAAAGSGAAAVVSVHLSGQLSGTVRSARLAAAGAALPVHVVDSLSIGMRLGFGVLAAARSAGRAGGGRGGGRSEPLGGQARFLFRPRLTGLPAGWRPARAARRGGGAPWRRAGTARRAARSDIPAAAACARRPDHRAGAGAHRSAAAARLAELAAEFAAGRPVDLAIQHLGNAERAAELSRRLAAAIPAAPTSRVAEAGAAILAHTGPGMLGVVVSPC
jgi:fatty acid-binding protein DegV